MFPGSLSKSKLGGAADSFFGTFDLPNLHNYSVSNHLLRRYDWIPRDSEFCIIAEPERLSLVSPTRQAIEALKSKQNTAEGCQAPGGSSFVMRSCGQREDCGVCVYVVVRKSVCNVFVFIFGVFGVTGFLMAFRM